MVQQIFMDGIIAEGAVRRWKVRITMQNVNALNIIKYGILEGNFAVPKELAIEAFETVIKSLEQIEQIQHIIADYYNPSIVNDACDCFKKIREIMEINIEKEQTE